MARHSTQAWFSQKAANQFGSWGMTLVTGEDVRITCLDDTPGAPSYNWSDKVYVGKVIEHSQHDRWDGEWDTLNNLHVGAVHPIVNQGVHDLASSGPATVRKKAPRTKLNIGDTCPVCGKEWKQRELATSTYIGCWCAEET